MPCTDTPKQHPFIIRCGILYSKRSTSSTQFIRAHTYTGICHAYIHTYTHQGVRDGGCRDSYPSVRFRCCLLCRSVRYFRKTVSCFLSCHSHVLPFPQLTGVSIGKSPEVSVCPTVCLNLYPYCHQIDSPIILHSINPTPTLQITHRQTCTQLAKLNIYYSIG